MFATGSHDGAVRIWTKRPGQPDEEDPIPRTNSPFEMTERESPESASIATESEFPEDRAQQVHSLVRRHTEPEIIERQASSGPSLRE